MAAPKTDALRELDELRLEVAELRASRMRLVLAADAERRTIERALHDGVQQQLVGLAANLELAAASVGDRPRGGDGSSSPRCGATCSRRWRRRGRSRTGSIRRCSRPGASGAALRSAAAGAGVPTRIDVLVGAEPARWRSPARSTSAASTCSSAPTRRHGDDHGAGASASAHLRDRRGRRRGGGAIPARAIASRRWAAA